MFGGNSCLGVSANYYSDTGAGEWGSVINYSAYGVGQNLGNDGSGGHNGRGNNAFGINGNFRNRHTNNANIISMYTSAVGDTGPWYVYDYADGGTQAPSDEGTKVIGTYEGGESFGYWHGTILTGGTGATLPTFNFTGGCGSMNACNPTDGGILLDTQTPIASGYFTGPSVNVSTGAVPLKALPVSTTLPRTTAWGHAEGISIPAQPERLPAAPATIALTMVTGSFSPGDHVCVEGTAVSGGFDEQSIVNSVSGSSITLPLAYPYTNVAIFKGGPCGTYISFSANLGLSGYRTSYHAIASFTGSDLIYAVPSAFGLNGSIGAGLPQAGAEPETTGGSSDPNAAFQTFCGAEIDVALAPNDDPVQIDPNTCAWTPGDTVESPHFPTQGVTGLWALINQNMPYTNNEGMTGSSIEMGGMGLSGGAEGYSLENLNNSNWYSSDGGKLTPPLCPFCSTGTWFDSLNLAQSPSNSVIEVVGHIPGQTSYDIFKDSGADFGGNIRLDASGFTFGTNVNTVGGFSGAGLSVSSTMNTESAGSTASVSVINGALTGATASFTQAGYSGSRADFGAVAYASTGPVTPLLSLKTDDTFGGPNVSGLVAYNSGGGAVPFLSVDSGPGATDTNLSLENGAAHCATLICLGPDATVGARRATQWYTISTSPAPARDADGGSGGGVSGSGGAGYLPASDGLDRAGEFAPGRWRDHSRHTDHA